MDINEVLGITIVGALLSFLVQYIKGVAGTESYATKILTIVLALVAGGAYVAIRETAIFPTVLLVLATASTVYSFLLK